MFTPSDVPVVTALRSNFCPSIESVSRYTYVLSPAHSITLSGTVSTCEALLSSTVAFALYPALSCLFPEKTGPAGTWTVTPDTLYLNETAIPRSSIRQIYCWPNRNALGQAGAGWTVNIETDRGHHLLRTLTKGEDAKRSARQLRAMVAALGYGSRWAGGEDDYDD